MEVSLELRGGVRGGAKEGGVIWRPCGLALCMICYRERPKKGEHKMQRIKLAGRAGAREAYRFLLFPGACSRAVGNLSPAALRPATLQLAACNLAVCSLAGVGGIGRRPGNLYFMGLPVILSARMFPGTVGVRANPK
jgi:hypothetical protein